MDEATIFALLRDDIANRQANVDRLIAEGVDMALIEQMLDYLENT